MSSVTHAHTPTCHDFCPGPVSFTHSASAFCFHANTPLHHPQHLISGNFHELPFPTYPPFSPSFPFIQSHLNLHTRPSPDLPLLHQLLATLSGSSCCRLDFCNWARDNQRRPITKLDLSEMFCIQNFVLLKYISDQ